jgi:hypothetical protein
MSKQIKTVLPRFLTIIYFLELAPDKTVPCALLPSAWYFPRNIVFKLFSSSVAELSPIN